VDWFNDRVAHLMVMALKYSHQLPWISLVVLQWISSVVLQWISLVVLQWICLVRGRCG